MPVSIPPKTPGWPVRACAPTFDILATHVLQNTGVPQASLFTPKAARVCQIGTYIRQVHRSSAQQTFRATAILQLAHSLESTQGIRNSPDLHFLRHKQDAVKTTLLQHPRQQLAFFSESCKAYIPWQRCPRIYECNATTPVGPANDQVEHSGD